MAMKLIFKRILPAFALYGCGIESYVLYNAFYGKPRELTSIAEAQIDVETLPIAVRAAREETARDVVDFYNLKVSWKYFDEFYTHNDPLFTMNGIETVKRYHKFWDKFLLPDCSGTLKSVTHYKSSMLLDIGTKGVTSVGSIDMKMTILLELANIGGSEKIVHMQEEWNCVPILYAKNTIFPVGWSAEILRKFLAKVIVALVH